MWFEPQYRLQVAATWTHDGARPIETFLYGQAGKQAGDPAKAAQVMIAVTESDDPPLRLMLGRDAYEIWDRTIIGRNADLQAWRERGEDTAFADSETIAIGG